MEYKVWFCCFGRTTLDSSYQDLRKARKRQLSLDDYYYSTSSFITYNSFSLKNINDECFYFCSKKSLELYVQHGFFLESENFKELKKIEINYCKDIIFPVEKISQIKVETKSIDIFK